MERESSCFFILQDLWESSQGLLAHSDNSTTEDRIYIGGDSFRTNEDTICFNSCKYRNLTHSRTEFNSNDQTRCYCSWHNKEIRVY